MPRTRPAKPRLSPTSRPTSSARPRTRSRQRVPPRPKDTASAPGSSNASGSATSCRKRSANSSSTTSGCGTTSAGRCSTADSAGRQHRATANLSFRPMATRGTLSKDARTAYEHDGSWVAPVLFDADEVDRFRKATERVVNGSYSLGRTPALSLPVSPSDSDLRKIDNAWWADPDLAALATD